jgi:hypothetical protein
VKVRCRVVAKLLMDDWAGRHSVECEVIGETPKRYRIKLLADAQLPSRRSCKAGDVVLVPKYAVRLDSKQSGATSGNTSENR